MDVPPITDQEKLIFALGASIAELLTAAAQIPPTDPDSATLLGEHLLSLVDDGTRQREHRLLLSGAAGGFFAVAEDD